VSHYSHILRGQQTGEDEFSPEDDDELGFANEHDLAKTAGSPAFFAPELCFSDLGPPSGGSSPNQELSTYAFPPSVDTRPGSRLSSHCLRPGSSTLRPDTLIARREKPPITEAIDLWALGVTLYCFLFGKVPFDSSSEFHLLSIIPVEEFPVPDTMGADQVFTGGRRGYMEGPGRGVTQQACEAIDLLTRLLEKDPVKRITVADVKVRSLDPVERRNNT
jgi:serine/threonine protein kinase